MIVYRTKTENSRLKNRQRRALETEMPADAGILNK